MEIGSTSMGVVGEEEGVMYQFSLDMQDYLPEDLLLQYEEEDIKGKLERCEPLVLTPLAVDGGDGHHPRVSPRWVVDRVMRTNCWHCLRRLRLPETYQGQKGSGNKLAGLVY